MVAAERSLIPAEERLIHALDLPTVAVARRHVEQLGDMVHFYKVGLELFVCSEGAALVDWLLARGLKVFLDLKFFDVPRTVAATVRQLCGRGIHFLSVHGDDAILQAAVDEKGDTGILAVTVLTSLDRGDLLQLGFDCDPAALVLSRARRAQAIGCDGVVASPQEAAALRRELGSDGALLFTPGIRPAHRTESDDQKRTAHAAAAITAGADYIVVGRPIHAAADPLAAVAGLQADIRAGLAARELS